jgi:hypothetical protein
MKAVEGIRYSKHYARLFVLVAVCFLVLQLQPHPGRLSVARDHARSWASKGVATPASHTLVEPEWQWTAGLSTVYTWVVSIVTSPSLSTSVLLTTLPFDDVALLE